jgi:AcrR family transcriptional regulator
MAKSTRQRLIDAAHDLFYRNGFLNVGLDRILGEVGVTKTTFYNHFESKDDLIVAVIQWHDQWWQEELRQQLARRAGSCPRASLMAVFDLLEDIFNDREYRGCMFINVTVEFPSPHDPVHQAAAASKSAVTRLLAELAAGAGSKAPQAFADAFSLVLEGAFVTRQLTGNPDTAVTARNVGSLLIEQYLPAQTIDDAVASPG